MAEFACCGSPLCGILDSLLVLLRNGSTDSRMNGHVLGLLSVGRLVYSTVRRLEDCISRSVVPYVVRPAQLTETCPPTESIAAPEAEAQPSIRPPACDNQGLTVAEHKQGLHS